MTFFASDLIRVSANLSFGVGGQDLVNVMYFELVAPSSLADSQVLSDIGEVLEILYTTVQGRMNTLIQFVDYDVKNETQDTSPLNSSWPVLTTGALATEALASQLVALVIMRTAQSRKFGRVNLGGFTELDNATDVWLAALLTNVGNFITQLLTTHVVTNGNYRYGVASQNVVPPRTIANSFDLPIAGKIIGNLRTQRRRSAGFGS